MRYKRQQAGLLDALLVTQPEVSCDELFDHVRKELNSFEGVAPVDAPSGFCGLLGLISAKGLGWIHFLQQLQLGRLPGRRYGTG